MKKPSIRKLTAQVETFNAQHDVGARVSYQKDNERFLTTVTRSRAEVLSGHSAVIWLDGVSGCVLLDRVTVLP